MATTEVVFKVWHPLTMIGGGHVSDLIFRDGRPLLVVEWDRSRTRPTIVVQLEWRHLHSMSEPKVQYLYDRRVEVPPSAVRRARSVMFVVIIVIVVIGAIAELFL
jgi:hypothetical protein